MSRLEDLRPATMLVSSLAGLTTWVTLLAWTRFAERPAGFMVPLMVGCLLVAVAGMLLRSARVPAPLVAIAQVLLLLLWLHHRLAGAAALGGFVPTPGSVRVMLDSIGQSSLAAQTFSAPVPISVPQFYPLLIVAGAAIAVLVDLLAVGLRRAPLAGLPLLAAYTAPVSILDGGVSPLKFAAAALCFLFLIAAEEDQRLSRWGQNLSPSAGLFEGRSAVAGAGPAVWSSARKIGGVTVGLAVVVPFVVPTFSAHLFDGGSGTGTGNGESVNIANPMVDLKRDLVRGADIDLLRITTTDPDPSYLRISVLNSFDGNAWRPSGRDIPLSQRAAGDVAAPPGLRSGVATKRYRASVSINDFFQSRWLPTPYPVTAVNAPGDWRYDRRTMDFISAADSQTTAGMSYTLRSLQVTPTARQLAEAVPAPLSVFTPNTSLPRSFPDSVRRIAESVTRGKVSRFEQAVSLQDWFRRDGNFRYSLAPSSGNGTDDLVRFLRAGKNGRVGYCEQFAAAMAVMGRSIGIPSRVAVGFLHPSSAANRTWVYSTHDLHAWPEMYFGGVGWVRFEPTPQGRTGGVPAYTTQRLPQAAPATGSSPSAPAPSAAQRNRRDQNQAAVAPTDGGSSTGGGSLLAWAALPLVAVVLLLAPRGLRLLRRRRRWAAAADAGGWAEAGWLEVRDTALDLGIVWDDRLSLRGAGAMLEGFLGATGAATVPGADAALRRLVELVERSRYARSLPEDATTADLVASDVRTCCDGLRAGRDVRRRRRATWLPASVFTRDAALRRPAGHRSRPVAQPGVDRAI